MFGPNLLNMQTGESDKIDHWASEVDIWYQQKKSCCQINRTSNVFQQLGGSDYNFTRALRANKLLS